MAEIQDIFSEHADEYRSHHRLPLNLIKAIKSIETCRTSLLGGHVDECDSCGHLRISYNSCRNRHCPKCQTLTKERWLEARKKDLLPVGYFHVVFTIPENLNYLALTNQKEIYSILFKAASETLLELGKKTRNIWEQSLDLLQYCIPGVRILCIILMSIVSYRVGDCLLTVKDG